MIPLSRHLGGWSMWENDAIPVTHSRDSPNNNWSKFHFGVLYPKQRCDHAAIPKGIHE